MSRIPHKPYDKSIVHDIDRFPSAQQLAHEQEMTQIRAMLNNAKEDNAREGYDPQWDTFNKQMMDSMASVHANTLEVKLLNQVIDTLADIRKELAELREAFNNARIKP